MLVQLLCGSQNLAGRHVNLLPVFIEKRIRLVFLTRRPKRVAPHPALGKPKVPQPVDIRVMNVEHGIGSCGTRVSHQSTHIHMHVIVRIALKVTLTQEKVGLFIADRSSYMEKELHLFQQAASYPPR
jgi:hypothetical protein